jgi:predicted DNA-binding transcriptional regulator AlpA
MRSPAQRRPGARSARRGNWPSMISQTASGQESNPVVPFLGGLPEVHLPATAPSLTIRTSFTPRRPATPSANAQCLTPNGSVPRLSRPWHAPRLPTGSRWLSVTARNAHAGGPASADFRVDVLNLHGEGSHGVFLSVFGVRVVALFVPVSFRRCQSIACRRTGGSAYSGLMEALAYLSVATWWRLHAAAKCPAPIRIGNSTRWRFPELREWIHTDCPSRAEWEARLRAAENISRRR